MALRENINIAEAGTQIRTCGAKCRSKARTLSKYRSVIVKR
jgi:hypothetical protein